ncbi:heme peroxidase [Pseudonocardia hierapolitana]|uniref:Heme peroxidase n=1 Tax=Pseudonocardia hierapolitana TaxID=1128676 RepID=A0A561SIP0_9PSEU|nr:heme peroxidase family protein [Pseudonocardia hierapolitana]TWF74694.1 heme peroxidase [Pseudonocardia hierapolitana]
MANDFPRVLLDLRHGEHVVTDELAQAQLHAAVPAPTSISAAIRQVDAPGPIQEISTPFGYLFPQLADDFPAAHLDADPAEQTVRALKALGAAMIEQQASDAGGDSTLPPILTYWGQFVDHDLTANTDRDDDLSITVDDLRPLRPQQVVEQLVNLREPRLNLDSVYGNGPKASGQPGQVPYDGNKFVIGEPTPAPIPTPVAGSDLPRVDRVAQIGDGRNDENLIVAQLHLAFLKFHNNVVDWLAGRGVDDFERARELTTWHYQLATVEDFLEQIADPGVVDGLLDGTIPPAFQPDEQNPFMPLEFSVAAYRFGHSMVRGAYDWNQNFGAPVDGGSNTIDDAPFDLLFRFTGRGGLSPRPDQPNPTLPDNWPAQFERLTGAEPKPADPDNRFQNRVARKIDTHLAPPLGDLLNEGTDPTTAPERIRRLLKRLAVRNLLRGYRLAIPTGQAVAAELGLVPLTSTQLTRDGGPVADTLLDNPELLRGTPLWFYVLKEAELGGGNRLGPVGSRIVAETLIGQLKADPASYLRTNFQLSDGVTKPDGSEVRTIIDFLQFAGMHP